MNRKNLQSGKFTLQSILLSREVPYYAILPKNYYATDKPFPVLYLLHGLFGQFDNWLTNTKIIEYAENFPFVIICCEGGNNWYSDSVNLPDHFYESYFFDELFPEIEGKFKVGKNRNSRAVGGLSMGGYGALKFAFRHPEMFCSAFSMSGAFQAAEVYNNDIWNDLQDSIVKVFGDDEQIRNANNLLQIAKDFPAEKISELPYFYFDCGIEDSFIEINLRLAEIFQRRGIAFEFNQFSGGHNWEYWDVQLRNILEISQKFFKY